MSLFDPAQLIPLAIVLTVVYARNLIKWRRQAAENGATT